VQHIIEELRERFERDPTTARPDAMDVTRWAGSSVDDELSFYNELGAALARCYSEGHLSFDLCDTIVNGLYSVLIEGQFRDVQHAWPHLFYDVFLAFDAGEWHRRADKSDDPVADHTDLQIAEIIARLDAGSVNC
jgi:hypothetical protein